MSNTNIIKSIIKTGIMVVFLSFILGSYSHTASAQPFLPGQQPPTYNTGGAYLYGDEVGAFTIVRCSGIGDGGLPRCNFRTLMMNINALINWFFSMCVLLATAYFAYGGILYMSGEPKKISDAHNIFTTVLKGFAVVLIAWAGIYTLVDWVVDKNTRVGQSATDLLEENKNK